MIVSPQAAAIRVAQPSGSGAAGATGSASAPAEVLNFCANNYLGLSSHPELVKAAQEALAKYGLGMSSVRFICGTQDIHKELERKISAFLGFDTFLGPVYLAAGLDEDGGTSFYLLLGRVR